MFEASFQITYEEIEDLILCIIIQIKLYRTKHKKTLTYSYKKGSYLISCDLKGHMRFFPSKILTSE